MISDFQGCTNKLHYTSIFGEILWRWSVPLITVYAETGESNAELPPDTVQLQTWCLTNTLLFSCSVVSDFSQPHGLPHTRLPCPSSSPGACSNLCPLSQWCHPTISFSIASFSSCPQSFPTLGSFPMIRLFASGGQSIRASASVLPMNIHSWFPLRLTGLVSLLSRDSQESSLAPQFESTHSSALSLLYGPTLTSVHNYWKSHSFDYTGIRQQDDISPF